jgi:hypothetical protein
LPEFAGLQTWSDAAQRLLRGADDDASGLGNHTIEPAHLTWWLLRTPEIEVGARALGLSLNPGRAMQLVLDEFPPRPPISWPSVAPLDGRPLLLSTPLGTGNRQVAVSEATVRVLEAVRSRRRGEERTVLFLLVLRQALTLDELSRRIVEAVVHDARVFRRALEQIR